MNLQKDFHSLNICHIEKKFVNFVHWQFLIYIVDQQYGSTGLRITGINLILIEEITITMKDFNQKDIDENMEEKVGGKLESFDSYTEDDAQKVMDNQEKIEKIASNETLHKYLNDIKLYFQMLGDIFTGKYKKVPVGTIAAIVGTLLYVLSPIDFIPDFIPGVGYLDDAAMLAVCLNFTRFDVEEYKKSRKQLLV